MMNENLEYLDGRITDVASSVTTVQSNLQTLNSTLTNNLNNAIAGVNAEFGSMPYSGFVDGLIITKSTDNTIAVTKGSCYDSTRAKVLKLTSNTTKQKIGMSSNATYYVYIIGSSDTSTIDIDISSNDTTPLPIEGFTLYRQIGYFKTDANGKIESVAYYGVDSDSNKVSGSIAPDYTAGISAYNGFVAPKDGVIVSQVTPLSASFLVIDGVSVNGGLIQASTAYSLRDEALIGKGSVVTYSGTVQSATFYPLKGAQ